MQEVGSGKLSDDVPELQLSSDESEGEAFERSEDTARTVAERVSQAESVEEAAVEQELLLPKEEVDEKVESPSVDEDPDWETEEGWDLNTT